jgi:hypothetical protein
MPIGSFYSNHEDPLNTYVTNRNLAIGAFRRVGFVGIAHARRYYDRDDQRILALYGYT